MNVSKLYGKENSEPENVAGRRRDMNRRNEIQSTKQSYKMISTSKSHMSI